MELKYNDHVIFIVLHFRGNITTTCQPYTLYSSGTETSCCLDCRPHSYVLLGVFLFISYLIYFLRATVVWFPVLSVHMVSKANRLPMLCAWGTYHRINLLPSSLGKKEANCVFLQSARLFTYTPSIIHQWFSRYFCCQTVITERRWKCSSFYTWLIQQTTTQSRYRRRSKKNEKWPELRGKRRQIQKGS